MSSKIIINLGFKLAIIYSIIISIFTIITETIVFLITRSVIINNIPKETLIPHLIILVIAVISYKVIEYLDKKNSKNLNVLDSILLSQCKPIFKVFLGILVIFNGIIVLILIVSNIVYYHQSINVREVASLSYYSYMIKAAYIRLAFEITKIVTGLGLLLGFKITK